jgi:hypothetical protein
MVVVAMFSAIESSDIQFQLFRPILKEPAQDMQYHHVIVSQEGLRIMDLDSPIAEFVELVSKTNVTYDSMPKLAEKFNRKKLGDDWFEYQIEVSTAFNTRWWRFVVDAKPSEAGLEEPDVELETARFIGRLHQWEPDAIWIRFLVAPDSIELFRAARQAALDEGFLTGWDTLDFEFPLRVDLRNNGDGPLSAGIQ